VNLHIDTSQLLVGLPNVENRAQEEAQSQQLDHNLKQSKSPHKIFGSKCEVQTRNASLLGNNHPSVEQKVEVFKKQAKCRESRWNDDRKQISDQVIILQSVRVSSRKSSVGTGSAKKIFHFHEKTNCLKNIFKTHLSV
jgi:hypothetical protein